MNDAALSGGAARRPFSPREQLRAWWRAARPRTLVASYIPVLLGSTFTAGRALRVDRFLLTLVGALAVQVATNLFNDYFDHVQGLDAQRATRGNMTIQTGALSQRAILAGAVGALLLGAGCGLTLARLAGPLVVWLALASAAAAVFYTARPLTLGYRRLGEATVLIFMGPVIVGGAAYAQQSVWDWRAAWGALPVALLTTAILHANNMRDADDDRRSGKRTLANSFGPRFALFELDALVIGAFAALPALCLVGVYGWTALLALAALPEALALLRAARRLNTVAAGNRLIGATARLDRNLGLLLVAGIVIGRLR